MARRRLYAALVLLLAVLLVYGQTARHEFVNFDDSTYVTGNPQVLEGLSFRGLRWAATSLEHANWHPLTWVSHMLDVQLFGPRPGAHHLVNVSLHAANALLLLHLLWGMTGVFWRSVLAASLFALHPLRVESVAWIAERKDVLSAFLMLCALAAYRRYARRPDWRRFLAVSLLFALGLMAKPMLVTFPFALLLLDYWPLGRFGGGPPPAVGGDIPSSTAWRLVLEKTPLFLLAIGSSLITYLAQKGGGAISADGGQLLGVRLSHALVSYVAYVGKTFWPAELAVFYPRSIGLPPLKVVVAAATLSAASAAAFLSARSRPYLLVGWLWFVGTLVPVSGIVEIGLQAMADRYTYIPHIGLFIALVWFLEKVSRPLPARTSRAIAAVLLVGICALLAGLQAGRWRNSETLMRSALTLEGGNWLAEMTVGESLLRQGRGDEALGHFQNAVRLTPQSDSPQVLNNLALALSALGRHGEALVRLEQALLVRPGDSRTHYNRGLVLSAANRLGEAERAYRRALELDGTLAAGHNNLGIVLARQGRLQEAAKHFAAALRLDPTDVAARANLDRALGRRGGAGSLSPPSSTP